MARRKHKELIQRTVHFKPENDQFVEKTAKQDDRSFSNMVDILISKMRQQESR